MKSAVHEQIDLQTWLSGVWHNQHNSELRLEVDKSGKITGFFINGDHNPDGKSEWYPLTGFARGDVFAFCVDFAKHRSMTTWVGQVSDPHCKSFNGMWQMISDAGQKPENCWKSTCVGEDTFIPGPKAKTEPGERRSRPLYCSLV